MVAMDWTFLILGLLGLPAWAQEDELALLNKTYDYIIVGGGTSGLTVANRLTENGKRTVLVLDYGYLNDDPSLLLPADTYQFHPERMYNITTLPIPGLNNRTSRVPAGAVVGGGSAVNGMFFDRGSAADYDAWETLGNPGWGWEGILPYFKKSVTFTPPTAEVAEAYNYTWGVESAYGGKGPIQVSYPPFQFPGMQYVWKAWEQLGIPKQVEGANGNAINVFQAPSALDPVTRTRSYARTAHYDPFRERENYHLLTGHQVTEIQFEMGLKAVGVNVVKRDTAEKFAVRARKEVVVAAGALWTPWLLQRSGIGPRSVLEAAGIEVKKDMPGVGANFQDHPVGGSTWNWTKNAPVPALGWLVSNATFVEDARKEYEEKRTGPLTVARGNQAAFLPLKTFNPAWQSIVDDTLEQDPRPYLPSTYDGNLINGFIAQQKLTAEYFQRSDAATIEFPFNAGPVGGGALMRTLSRGTVNINTTDPLNVPVVDYNTLSNPIDVRNAIAQVRYLRKVNSAPVFEGFGPVELTPGLNITSDADIERFLRTSGYSPSFAHPSGTASMLPEDYGGVVGPDLRVYGTNGLSIVDASVMPFLPATHLCTTVYAVAEKAADLIKERSGET